MFTVGDEPGGHLQGGVPVLAAREVLHIKQGYCQEDKFVHCTYLMWQRMSTLYTDKKVHKIFLMYKEIQMGSVAKSYMTNGLLYG